MTNLFASINASTSWDEIKAAAEVGGGRVQGHALRRFARDEETLLYGAVCACGKTYRPRRVAASLSRAHQWHLGRVLRIEAREAEALVEREARAEAKALAAAYVAGVDEAITEAKAAAKAESDLVKALEASIAKAEADKADVEAVA